MSKSIIATNVTDEVIYIDDLAGQYLGISTPLTLSDLYTPVEISLSNDLETAILEGHIIINNGTIDLDPEKAIKFINNEEVENLTEIFDISNIPEYDGLLISDGTAFTWAQHFAHGGGKSTGGGINFTMSDHASHDYVANGDNTYTNIRTFIYDGSQHWLPGKFSIIASLSASTTGYARLYDYTNNNEICEVSFTNITKGLYTTIDLQNIPTNESIIELQTKVAQKGRDIRLHFMALY